MMHTSTTEVNESTMDNKILSGSVTAISISKKKGIPKTNVSSAKLVENFGIENDAHAGNWHRQVSLLPLESIEKMRRAGLPSLRPGAFAENLTIEGIALNQLPIGTKIQIGEVVQMEITQIGKECHDKCAIFFTVGDCVMPREGIFGRVLAGGEIRVGETVRILKDEIIAI